MLVDVGGHRLYLECQGTGSPTVVLDAGLNHGAAAWADLQAEVATFTRVCSYDRAGFGRSDVVSASRTCADLADDLYALLAKAGVSGPCVLVGHSFGGLIARLFAHRYPGTVAGMVLVDAPHPDYPRRALELFPSEAAGEHPEITESRVFFSEIVQGIDEPVAAALGVGWATCLEQVRAAGNLGDLPLVVIGAGAFDAPPPGFPADLSVKIHALLREKQRELTRLSTNSRLLIAQHSGHMIPQDQPEIVVEAIRLLVDAARERESA